MEQNLKIPIMKTINEAAQMTGLAKYQVRKLVLNNKIKYVTSGKKFLVNMNSLINYLNEGDVSTTERNDENDRIKKL